MSQTWKLKTSKAPIQTFRVTVMAVIPPPGRSVSRRTIPCWSSPCPLAKVAHTVWSVPLRAVRLQKNSRLLPAPDFGAVTISVPGDGFEYV